MGKRDKKTNKCWQNTTQETKDWAIRTPQKLLRNSLTHVKIYDYHVLWICFICFVVSTVYNRTVLKNGSCCTVRPGKVSCLQKFRHFWMIIRDLFFVSGSTEARKIKQILQRYVIYISDQITVPYLNTETGNRRLSIVDGMFSLEERG